LEINIVSLTKRADHGYAQNRHLVPGGKGHTHRAFDRCLTFCRHCCVFVALRVDLDAAAAKAVDQQTRLKSTSSTLNTITIGLIAWAVAISVAVAVMTTLIVRRMRVLRARAQRLAATKNHAHIDFDGAVLDTESRGERAPTEAGDFDATSVVDLDLGAASPQNTVGPQQA